MYHICGIFLIPQEGKKLPLDVPFPENMVSPDGGERSAAVPCFSLYVNQSSGCSFSQIHTYLFWDDVFFGVFLNFMQVMPYDMGTSPGHRRGGLIFCISRGLSSPHRKNLLRGSFSIGTFRDILTSIHKHISRYLYHGMVKRNQSKNL